MKTIAKYLLIIIITLQFSSCNSQENTNITNPQLTNDLFDRMKTSGRLMGLASLVQKKNELNIYNNSKLEKVLYTLPQTNFNENSVGMDYRFEHGFIVVDIVKNNQCGYAFRVFNKKGMLGWISACDDLLDKDRAIINAITNINKEDFNENNMLIKELKKGFGIEGDFLTKNNPIVSDYNKWKYDGTKIVFDCDYNFDLITVDKDGVGFNGKEKFEKLPLVKDRNALKIFINSERKLLLINKKIYRINELSDVLISFIDNQGGNPESSDNPKKVVLFIKGMPIEDFLLVNRINEQIKKAYSYFWDRMSNRKYGLDFNSLSCDKKNEIRHNYYPVRIRYYDNNYVFQEPKTPPPVQPVSDEIIIVE